MHHKSQFLGFILTFIFGPLGLFYSSAWAALIYIAVIILAVVGSGDPTTASAVGTIVWLASIVTSFITVSGYNKKVDMFWLMR